MSPRQATLARKTKETDVRVEVNLDGAGVTDISTGVGFADHMLTLTAFWAGIDLLLACKGDLEVDAHHSLEDIGLTLGQAMAQAMGDRAGICRIGWARVPMDESLADVALDISGRPYLVYDDAVLPALIAGEEKDLWREFFKSLAQGAKLNLHIRFAYGQNGHHLLESAFKGLGLALRQALTLCRAGVPSTKGSLE